MFVKAGVNPRFCLFLSGESGSFKTTLAVLLATIFNRDSTIAPTAQFTATAAHLEKFLNFYCDNVIIIDDMHPSTSAKARNAMAAKLELVLRIVGDDTGKGRGTDSILENDTPKPNALAIITGEFFSTEYSSAARCFHLAMSKKDVKVKFLNYCQNEALSLSTFAYRFIEWVAHNFDDLVSALRQRHLEYRALKGNFVHARFADMHNTLLMAHALLLDFLSSTGVLNQEAHNKLFSEFAQMLDRQITMQEQCLKNNDPLRLFFSCIAELISARRILISRRYEICADEVHGFYDENYYYLFKESVYGAVERFLNVQNRKFPIPLETLIDQLRNHDLIECDRDNRLPKVKINARQRVRMLKFNREEFRKLCEKLSPDFKIYIIQ